MAAEHSMQHETAQTSVNAISSACSRCHRVLSCIGNWLTSTTQDIFPRFSSWTQRTPKALKSPFIFPSRFEALTSVEDDDNRVITEWSHAKTALDAQLTVIGAAAVSLLGVVPTILCSTITQSSSVWGLGLAIVICSTTTLALCPLIRWHLIEVKSRVEVMTWTANVRRMNKGYVKATYLFEMPIGWFGLSIILFFCFLFDLAWSRPAATISPPSLSPSPPLPQTLRPVAQALLSTLLIVNIISLCLVVLRLPYLSVVPDDEQGVEQGTDNYEHRPLSITVSGDDGGGSIAAERDPQIAAPPQTSSTHTMSQCRQPSPTIAKDDGHAL